MFLFAAAGGGFEETGFVDDAREVIDDALAGEFLGLSDADEGDVGAAEEFFHVLRVAAGVFLVVFFLVVDFDGTDGAEGSFITEDKVDGFVFDETVGFVAALGADLVTEEGIEADAGDDVEFLAEEFVQELETLTFDANHKVFAGAITAAVHSFAVAAAGGDADKRRDEKEKHGSEYCAGEVDFVGGEEFFDLHNF